MSIGGTYLPLSPRGWRCVLAFAATAVAFGGWAILAMRESAARERDLIGAIAARGGSLLVRFDWEPESNDYRGYQSPVFNSAIERAASPSGPAWLRAIIGDEPFQRVDRITLAGHDATDETVDSLAAFSCLRVLRMPYSRLSPARMAVIARCGSLQILDLSKSTVTDAMLSRLRGLRKLSALGLADTNVTDAGLGELGPFPRLEELDLSNTRITDGGLRILGGFPNLRRLFLRETAVTDDGIRSLAGLASLQLVQLTGGTKATARPESRC